MILYIHSRVLPLNTFVINAKANWSILRIRGYLLHKLAEIGHHRHPFRLRYKGRFLRDSLTLRESGIVDTVSLELVPLATVAELQADLFWRYTRRDERDEPHLIALEKEKAHFDRRTKMLSYLKLSLLALFPWCVFDFFMPSSSKVPLWLWGLAQGAYAAVGLHFAPGYSYQSGWVGKLNQITKSEHFDYFRFLVFNSF